MAHFYRLAGGAVSRRLSYAQPPSEDLPGYVRDDAPAKAAIPLEALIEVAGQVAAKPAVTISSDKAGIQAADPPVDKAVVTVEVSGAEPLPGSIVVDINGMEEIVPLDQGVGQFEVYADSPCEINITVADGATYWDRGGMIIEAV